MVPERSLGKITLDETKLGLGNRICYSRKAGRRIGSQTDMGWSNEDLGLMGMSRTGGVQVTREVVSTQRGENLQKQLIGYPCLALVEASTTSLGQEGGEMSHLSTEGMQKTGKETLRWQWPHQGHQSYSSFIFTPGK